MRIQLFVYALAHEGEWEFSLENVKMEWIPTTEICISFIKNNGYHLIFLPFNQKLIYHDTYQLIERNFNKGYFKSHQWKLKHTLHSCKIALNTSSFHTHLLTNNFTSFAIYIQGNISAHIKRLLCDLIWFRMLVQNKKNYKFHSFKDDVE